MDFHRNIKIKYENFLSDERNKILFKNSFFSFLSKGVTMLTGFILIPLSLKLVEKNEFGLWLAISSFLGWMSLLDLGVGNGLRNKLTEALAKNDIAESKSLISTAYFITSIVFLTAIFLFVGISYFINWGSVFNVSYISEEKLRNVVIITFTSFSINMILRLIYSIYMSTHKVGLVDLLLSLGQICIVAAIYIIIYFNFTFDELMTLVFINNIIPLFVLLIATLYTYYYESPNLRPALKNVEIAKGKSIFGLGIQFLIIQLASFILIGSQQFLIGKLFSQSDVVAFSVPHKFYSILLVGWTIILSPFWSLLTEAYKREEIDWIYLQKERLFSIYILIPLSGIILFYVAPTIYNYWVGDTYIQDPLLDISLIMFYCVICLNSTIVIFLNAFSRTKTQLVISISVSILSVATCFIVNRVFDTSFFVIPLICSVCLLIAGIVVYIDLNNYLNKLKNQKINVKVIGES